MQRRYHGYLAPPRRHGAIAQLGERLDRTQEVVGSSPTSSTSGRIDRRLPRGDRAPFRGFDHSRTRSPLRHRIASPHSAGARPAPPRWRALGLGPPDVIARSCRPRDDAGAQRDLGAREAVRIAAPVHALMVGAHQGRALLERRCGGQDPFADHAVLLDQVPLVVGQRARLAQYRAQVSPSCRCRGGRRRGAARRARRRSCPGLAGGTGQVADGSDMVRELGRALLEHRREHVGRLA